MYISPRSQRSLKIVHLGSVIAGALKYSLCFLLEMEEQLNLYIHKYDQLTTNLSFLLYAASILLVFFSPITESWFLPDICSNYIGSCTGFLDFTIYHNFRKWQYRGMYVLRHAPFYSFWFILPLCRKSLHNAQRYIKM